MAFWAELRRRKVIRVAAAYLVTAWIVMQVVNVAAPALELPGWFDGAVLLLLATGFAVAVVVSWVFELTPEGLKVTAPAGHGEPAARLSRVDVAMVGALLAVLAVSGIQILGARPAAIADRTAGSADGPSIAVLPFVNMSSDPEQEYFSDGLSEELLNELAQVAGLRVIGRTSSFAFKGENQDLRQVGQALGVGHLLEGSVRKSGDRLRITAQLIDASDGSHLWSETYERQLDDVFAIQEEIATAVVDELALTLGVGARGGVARGTDNTEAYDLYLRGVSWYNQGGPEGFERADALFEQAAAADADFADAWMGLADAKLRLLIFAADDDVDELRERATAALDRAVVLAPASPRVHQLRADLLAGGRDWRGAAQAIARAREVSSPEEGDCLESELAVMLGRLDDTLVECRFARRAADPLSLRVSTDLQRALFLTRRAAEAEDEYRRSFDLIGARGPVEHGALFRAWASGDPERVEAQLRRFIAATEVNRAPLERVLAAGDDAAAALAVMQAAIVDPANQEPLTQYGYATLLASYGDAAGAAAGLQRAYARPGGVPYPFIWIPVFAETRREPAFKDLMRDLGMADYWRQTGNWSDFCRPVGDDDFECS